MSAAQNQDVTSLVDALVVTGAIDNQVASVAKAEFVSKGTNPVEWLLKKKNISEEDVVVAKSQLYGIPKVNLTEKPASPVALSFVDATLAKRFMVFPFDFDRVTNTLMLAMTNPVDLPTIEFLQRKAGVTIQPYVASSVDIQVALDTKYSQTLSTEVKEALKESGETGDVSTKSIDIRNVGQYIKEAPIAKIVTTILEFAVKSRASDVHIEPSEDKTRVRYRIDGILHEKLVLPKNIHDSLTSRIKILSGMKIDERRAPQDGRFNFQLDDNQVDLRVSTLPTVHGEKIVMRLLKKTNKVPSLAELGLRGQALKNLEEAVLRPHGIILATGPTGSGKTTTLYSLINKINSVKLNIVTIEDPVEYQMVGVNQVQVNTAAGLTFAQALRSFLRQDPNVIFVGEIRDEETAELAVQASLTGHLVLSTLHTSSSAGALPRLLDMKAEPYLLASSISAVVAQRVVRVTCNVCKVQYEASESDVQEITQVLGNLWKPATGKIMLARGEGCTECGNTGFKGRIGIYEVLTINDKISRLILEHASAQEIEKLAVENGMLSMKQDGYLRVVEGVTTLDEVLRVAQE